MYVLKFVEKKNVSIKNVVNKDNRYNHDDTK